MLSLVHDQQNSYFFSKAQILFFFLTGMKLEFAESNVDSFNWNDSTGNTLTLKYLMNAIFNTQPIFF